MTLIAFFCEAFKHDGYYHLVRAGYGDSSTAKITNCDRMHSGIFALPDGYLTYRIAWGLPQIGQLFSLPAPLI